MFMWTPTQGIQGFDWRWLFLAVALDIGNSPGSAYTNRHMVPASIPGGTRPATT